MEREDPRGSPTVKGMYDLFLGNMTFTLLLALTAIAVGRVLGPSGYGLYSVALIVPPFLFTAIRLGLDSAATRFAARLRSEGKYDEAVSFVNGIAVFGVVVAAAATLAFVGASGWIATRVVDRPQLGAVVIPVAMLSVLGQAAFNITDLGITGLGRFGRAALIQGLQGVTKLFASVGLVLLGFGVAGAVAGYTLSFLVSGGAGFAYVVWLAKGKFPRGMGRLVGAGLRYSFPVYLSTMALGFVAPVLYTTMALTVPDSQIGGYAEAGSFISLTTLLTYPITTALFPLFSSLLDRGNLGRTYQKAVRYTALLVTPVAAYIMAFSGPLMVTVYGGAYAFASAYLALFAVISLLAGMGSLAWTALLNGVGRTRDALWTTLLGSVVSTGAGVGLIGVVGAPGAIVGQIAGGTAALAVGTWMVKRGVGAGPQLGRVWKFYAASGVSAGLCEPLSWLLSPSWLAVAAGAGCFVALLIPLLAALEALEGDDLVELRGFLGFSTLARRVFDAGVRYYELSLGTFHGRKTATG